MGISGIRIERHQAAANARPHLTLRECEILKWIARGETAKRIGLKLKISYRTVEKYIENLKRKFSCHTKSELVYTCLGDPVLREFILE